jgi:hypothetical protein
MKFERANARGSVESGFRATADDRSREPITVRPPFDPVTFARESDSNLRVLEEGEAPSNRPTVPPPPGLPDYSAAVTVDSVPELIVAREDLEWFDLTPQARKVLQYVDGESPVRGICEKLRSPADDVIAELERLAGEGLVGWH